MKPDIVTFAIDAYSYIIRDKGVMTGKDFAEEIRKVYDCIGCKRNGICAQAIEEHVDTIEYSTGYMIKVKFK